MPDIVLPLTIRDLAPGDPAGMPLGRHGHPPGRHRPWLPPLRPPARLLGPGSPRRHHHPLRNNADPDAQGPAL